MWTVGANGRVGADSRYRRRRSHIPCTQILIHIAISFSFSFSPSSSLFSLFSSSPLPFPTTTRITDAIAARPMGGRGGGGMMMMIIIIIRVGCHPTSDTSALCTHIPVNSQAFVWVGLATFNTGCANGEWRGREAFHFTRFVFCVF